MKMHSATRETLLHSRSELERKRSAEQGHGNPTMLEAAIATKDFELLLLDLVEPAEHHTNPTSPQIGMLNRIASNSQSLDGILKWARVDDNVKEAIAEAVRLLAAFRAFALATGERQ